uniref:Helicase ATP-binding domain-containing protein n=1 Tax=viral metagenome TaxID=1070528 RepID=A0A6C0AVN3_9ZZZZ
MYYYEKLIFIIINLIKLKIDLYLFHIITIFKTMVVICSNSYTSDNYNEYYNKYSFDLSPFQKYAIEAIINDQHVLVTAHTGSGKTLPAEFAIEYFHAKGKKVIYTSPIKALSNQKYYEFSQKFPQINFGILTGDMKFNPEADVLIMTTEILQNYLYKRLNKTQQKSSNIHFEMDIENELGCVIFDEIHYINDADRGKVWEETIMMLPSHVQMVMLSATIDNPAKFATWCEEQHKTKKVYLCSTNERVVPLHHYCYINMTNGVFKKIKDKDTQAQIRKIIGKPHAIKKQNEGFQDQTYLDIKNYLDLFYKHQLYASPAFVLNELSKYLKENNMLPALCFVFSRKNVEKYASLITVNLLEDDSKIPYIIDKECEQLLRSKIPNYQEYIELPEYKTMISLLQKGIAVHHSGIMPILREIVELMYSKGYIKLLFATETFAVGLNMPTKTVIFSNLSKYTSSGVRMLLGHEYTQMAGRAGRRNIDTVGHVIHCNNLFGNNYPTITEYKTILSGIPQTLKSKFAISYHLLMNLTSIGELDFKTYIERSMMQEDIDNNKKYIDESIEKLELDIQNKEQQIKSLSRVPIEDIETYNDLNGKIRTLNNKKRKNAERELSTIKEKHGKLFDNDKKRYDEFIELKNKLNNSKSSLDQTVNFVVNKCNVIYDLLKSKNYLLSNDDNSYSLDVKGTIASHIHESHCLAMTDFIYDHNGLNNLSVDQLVGLFSIFTNIRVSDDIKASYPYCQDILKSKIVKLVDMCNDYYCFEVNNMIDRPIDIDTITYDIINESMEWCKSEDEAQCKNILQKLNDEKSIFLGEFVKALLKINNMASELETVCETYGNIELLSKLKQIPEKTMKFVATNQSLYV